MVIFADGRCPKCGGQTHGYGGPMKCSRCGWEGEEMSEKFKQFIDKAFKEAFPDEEDKPNDSENLPTLQR